MLGEMHLKSKPLAPIFNGAGTGYGSLMSPLAATQIFKFWERKGEIKYKFFLLQTVI